MRNQSCAWRRKKPSWNPASRWSAAGAGSGRGAAGGGAAGGGAAGGGAAGGGAAGGGAAGGGAADGGAAGGASGGGGGWARAVLHRKIPSTPARGACRVGMFSPVSRERVARIQRCRRRPRWARRGG